MSNKLTEISIKLDILIKKIDSLSGVKESSEDANENWLNQREVMELWGCSAPTVERAVRDGVIKKYRAGRMVRYKQSEVLGAFQD